MSEATTPRREIDMERALRTIVEGTAERTGDDFFRALVRSLAQALDVHGAWVTDYVPEVNRLRARAFWLGDRFVPHYEYALAGTPCETVVTNRKLVHVPDRLVDLYVGNPDLRAQGAMSYLGVPLLDLDGEVLGHLSVLDTRPLPEDPRCLAIFQIFAARAADELRRLRAEARMTDSQQALKALALEADYLRHEVSELGLFEEILGRSEAIQRVLREIRQVADTGASVLILGETGTGKELVARALHGASQRAGRPFIKVNCAAIPATLIESEFFGHERGAFTGATQSREGRFALAHTGTIFLDEVGELPLELQSKLLRVLQEGEFEPVGSAKTRKVDVRVLAATNRDLASEVREGRFREDLYYRLNVFPIRVPPLRERGDDIEVLAVAFARKSAERMARPVPVFTDECFRRLRAYPWPGNVRELQNVIERAVITATGTRLHLEQCLPETGRIPQGLPAPAAPGGRAPAEGDAGATDGAAARIRTVQELEELERENILRALDACEGRVSGDRGAARRLGMKPTTLTSRMKSLGIRRA
ncbi:MAG TPA: sigma 54-interacting transcriptional regulator [Acidobacteriota bacterium]|nr:sigma 54-interacting transcriptional regulator [Acidobacteriota bacterium]